MKPSFQVGDMVFAKVRGYPAWPARVFSIEEKSGLIKYDVYFFGTEETGSVLQKNIFLYSESKDMYGKPNKRKGFNEGIEALEKELEKMSNGQVLSIGVDLSKLTEADKVENRLDETEESGNKESTTEDSLKRKYESKVEENDKPVAKKKRWGTLVKVKMEQTGKPNHQERTSQFGRVIKQKRFLYDMIEEDMEIEVKANPVISEEDDILSSKTKEEKIPVDTKLHETMGCSSGEMIQSTLGQDRTFQLKNEKALNYWERAVVTLNDWIERLCCILMLIVEIFIFLNGLNIFPIN